MPTTQPARPRGRLRLYGIVVFAVLVAVPVATARASDLIAFASGLAISNIVGGLVGQEERGGIFVMRPDGTGLKQITSFQTLNFRYQPDVFHLPDDHPSFSPDGRFLLFSSSRSDDGGLLSGLGGHDDFEVFIVRVNGSELRRLTFNPLFDGEAAFSPDGTKIAFVSQAAGLAPGQELEKPNIFLMDVNGNLIRRVTQSGFSDVEPTWSPDGTRIVYTRVTDEGGERFGDEQKHIRICDADGTNKNDRLLFDAPNQDHDANFHPSGGSVVMTSELAGTFPYGDVVRVGVPTTGQGSVISNLTVSDTVAGIGGGGDPVYSPDGSRIAYIKAELGILRGPQKIHVMNANGTGKVKIDQGIPGQLNIHPGWGPMADSDGDGTPDYLEPANVSIPLALVPGFGFVNEDQELLDYDFARFGAALALADLNHDFRLDLVAGSPGHEVAGLAGAGSVGVLFGSSSGPRYFENPADTLGGAAVSRIATARPAPIANGNFGAAMAAGDFNDDGFRDAAVGAPGNNAVFVHLGGAVSQMLTGSGAFGAALASGDFNRDGFADLAVGSPNEVRSSLAAGAVRVFYGSSGGLVGPPQVIDQGNIAMNVGIGRLEAADRFGAMVAAGDVSGDGTDDLAIGAPGEDILGVADTGVVHVIAGAIGQNLPIAGAIHRDLRSAPEPRNVLQSGAQFGSVAAIGRFRNGAGSANNLVVGVPDYDIPLGTVPGTNVAVTQTDTGIVVVFEGRTAIAGSEALGTGVSVWTGENLLAGLPATTQLQTQMRLGQTLAVGHLSGDGIRDLAVAAPGHHAPGAAQAGSVFLVPGSSTATGPFVPVLAPTGGGLLPSSAQRIDQASVGTAREVNDRFGGSLSIRSANTMAIGDIDGDGLDDLFIGSPHESGPAPEQGLVSLRYGIGVGTFELVPQESVTTRGRTVDLAFTWTHPDVWTDLDTIQLRVANETNTLLWLKLALPEKTLSLMEEDRPRNPHGRDDPKKLRTRFASVDRTSIEIAGSGPTGRSVTLHLPIDLAASAPPGEYRVEAFATDVHGNSQGFDLVGSVIVEARR